MLRIAVVLLGVALMACGGRSAQTLPPEARAEGATFYVENHGKDERNLEQVIAATLQERGLQVSSGARDARPEGVDYIVTYEDRWSWDMRTYLGAIRIEVADADSGRVVATSKSSQSSLRAMGKSHEVIVRAVTTALLDGF